MEKEKIAIVTIVVFVVGLIITGASYAFWSWSGNINKNVVFNVASNLKNYIVYNEGESAFTGELNVSNNYQTNSIHSTISIYKTANVNLLATIHMDINRIGSNMKQSRALKWVVTEGTTSNVGSVLAQGNFVGTNNGDVLTLVPEINVATTETFYTIWIWLDSSENPAVGLSGETLDTNVWTEINQTEGSEDRYEITHINANYQQISATVVDSKYKVTAYAITQSSTEPSSWTTITPSTDQTSVYTLNASTAGTGTYYVWFKDENDRVISKQITVSTIDNVGPTGSIGVSVANTNVTLSLEDLVDSSIGLSSVHGWKVSTSATCDSTVSDFTENTNNSYSFTADGTSVYYVCVKLSDVAGNITYLSSATAYEIRNSSNGLVGYANDLNGAFSLVPNNGSVKSLYSHQTAGATNTKTIDFDLNGTTIELTSEMYHSQGTMTLAHNGEFYSPEGTVLEVTGGIVNISNGTLSSASTDPSTNRILNVNGGTLNLSGGTFDAQADIVMPLTIDAGTLNISDGSYSKTTGDMAILYTFGGTTNITGGTFTSALNVIHAAFGTLNISGGSISTNNTFPPIVVYGATLNLSGGTITGTQSGEIYMLSGEINVTNGTFNQTSSKTFIRMQDGVTNITGGTITSVSNVIRADGGIVNMSGGTISTSTNSYPVYINGATFNLSGGSIDSTQASAICINNGTFNLTDGTYNYTGSVTFLKMSGGTAYITGGAITSSSNVIRALGGTTNISDGEFSSPNHIAIKVDGGTLNISDGYYEYDGGVYFIDVDSGLVNITGGTIISLSSNAFILSVDGGIVNMSDGTISQTSSSVGYASAISVSGGTFNLSGGEIIAYLPISVGGSGIVNITGGTYDHQGVNNEVGPFIEANQGGELNISGGSITSTAEVLDLNDATTNITAGTLTTTGSTYLINVNGYSDTGSLNISGGTFVAASANPIRIKWGELNITAGTFTHDGSKAFLYATGGDTTISGGTINVSQSAAVSMTGGTVSISDGTLTSSSSTIMIYNNGGTLNVSGGTLTTSTTHCIRTKSGTTNITAGTYQHAGNYAFFSSTGGTTNITGGTLSVSSATNLITASDGTINISAGTFTSTATSSAAIYNNGGTINISGGTHNSTSTYPMRANAGIINITGGTYTHAGSKAFVNVTGGIVNLNGGSITSSSSNVVSESSGIVNVNGTTITSTSTSSMLYKNGGTLNINSGILTSNNSYAIYEYAAGTTNITGGTISGTNGYYGYDAGIINITGGTLNGSMYGIYDYAGSVTIGEDTATAPDTSTPVINSTSSSTSYYGVKIGSSSATFNFYDGRITSTVGTGYALNATADTLVNTPSGYGVIKTTTSGIETATLAKILTVTADATGGTIPATTGWTVAGNGLTATKGILQGTTYGTLPIPTKTGNTFTNWYTASSGGTVVNASTAVSATADHSIYAQWSANTYYVAYNKNTTDTVSNMPSSSTSYTYAASGNITLSSATPTRTGYNFLGWSTSSTATSASYSAGGNWAKSNVPNSGDTFTLYAVWSAKSITCTGGNYLPAGNDSCSQCPANSYCGGGTWTYDGSQKGRTLCTSLASGSYTTSSAGSSAASACYIPAANLSGKFVASANAEPTNCTAGGYCPGTSNVSYGSTGGRTPCTAGTANANTGSSAASACAACTGRTKYSAQGASTCSTVSTGYYTTGCTSNNNCTGQTICPAGSYCLNGVNTACAQGSYTNTTGKTACTACTGTTTSGTGKTSCDATCSNNSNASTWNSASWSANSVTNLCSIATCASNYFLASNACYPTVTNLSYTGSYQLYTVPKTGYYRIETWGASANNSNNSYISSHPTYGGYSGGYISLTAGDKIYVYVGGTNTAFNHVTTTSVNSGAGSGGATDIRYFGSTTPSSSDLTWNSTLGLNSRIMVAGGAGGTYGDATGSIGGHGGGINAQNASPYSLDGGSMGGTQIAGGNAGNNGTAGTFGVAGTDSTAWYPYGGSGYYGAGGGSGSGGGSSFISGYAGVNAITSASNRTHTNTIKHYSGKYFVNATMQIGTNSGNGKAKITYYGTSAPAKTNSNLNNVRYIKDCVNPNVSTEYSSWREIQAVKDGVNIAKGKSIIDPTESANQNRLPYTAITDGLIYTNNWSLAANPGASLKCVTVDLGATYALDEVVVWHNGTDTGGTFSYTDYLAVSSDKSTWTHVVAGTSTEDSLGKRYSAWS